MESSCAREPYIHPASAESEYFHAAATQYFHAAATLQPQAFALPKRRGRKHGKFSRSSKAQRSHSQGPSLSVPPGLFFATSGDGAEDAYAAGGAPEIERALLCEAQLQMSKEAYVAAYHASMAWLVDACDADGRVARYAFERLAEMNPKVSHQFCLRSRLLAGHAEVLPRDGSQHAAAEAFGASGQSEARAVALLQAMMPSKEEEAEEQNTPSTDASANVAANASAWSETSQRSPEESTAHGREAIVAGAETTVVLKNLNRQKTRDQMISEIGLGTGSSFSDFFDFFYLPWIVDKNINHGYAIVNFRDPICARQFLANFKDPRIEITLGHKQGLRANLKAFLNKGARLRNSQCVPKVRTKRHPSGVLLAGDIVEELRAELSEGR